MPEPAERDRDALDRAIDRVATSIVDAPGVSGAGRRVVERLPTSAEAPWWPRVVAGTALASAVALLTLWFVGPGVRQARSPDAPHVAESSSRPAPASSVTAAAVTPAAPVPLRRTATGRVARGGVASSAPPLDESEPGIAALAAPMPIDLVHSSLLTTPIDETSSLVVAPLDIAPLEAPGDARTGDIHER